MNQQIMVSSSLIKNRQLSPESNDLIQQAKSLLYTRSSIAKIWGVASESLGNDEIEKAPSVSFGRYDYVASTDWTAGFFPGSLYLLVERALKHPELIPDDRVKKDDLISAARKWSKYLEPEVNRTDTHDLGFIIEPALIREYEFFGTESAKNLVVTAAYSLSERYHDNVGMVQSWNSFKNKVHDLSIDKGDYLVIIDNMMNLDLLFWASSQTKDRQLYDIGVAHASKALKDFIRHPIWSTYHVVDYDADTGDVRQKITAQGWRDDSTWSRGQAWAIHGFAETFKWTHDEIYAEASKQLANYFMDHLETDGVPRWDFDAPQKDIRDTSAAMAAADGMIKLYDYTNDEEYLQKGLKLTIDTITGYKTQDAVWNDDGSVRFGDYDTILRNSTTNNNPDAATQLFNHGLVYADYYYLDIGNRLLSMGI